MSPDALGLFGLDDAQPAPADPAVSPMPRWPLILIAVALVDVHILVAIFGLALLMALVAPRRVEGGLARLGSSPVAGFALGVAAFVALAVVGALLWHFHLRPGRGLIGVLAIFGLAAGYAVCGRALGERAAPERSPLAQTLIGLAALVLPLAMPIGIPVMLVAAPLGLGCWLLGPRRSAVV